MIGDGTNPAADAIAAIVAGQSSTPSDSGGILAQVGNAISTGVTDVASLIRALSGGNTLVSSQSMLPTTVNASALGQILKVLGGAAAVGGATELGAGAVQSLLGGGGSASRSPRTRIETYTDKNGNLRVRYWVSKGQPVLWSGDIASVRRVQRVARRVRGQSSRRRSVMTRVMCAGCGLPVQACGCGGHK